MPAGKRITQLDGDPQNFRLENLAALTGGEVAQLYHRLDPDMAIRNRRSAGQHLAEFNLFRSQLMRATRFVKWQWYLTNQRTLKIVGGPRRSRSGLLLAAGLLDRPDLNGALGRRAFGDLLAMRGDELNADARFALQVRREKVRGAK